MSNEKTISSLRRRYLDYLDLNKHISSYADLGVRHPSIIELNIFVELMIEYLVQSRQFKNVAKVVIDDFSLFIKSIFLNETKHTTFLEENNAFFLHKKIDTKSKFDLVFCSFPWAIRINKEDDKQGRYKKYLLKNGKDCRVNYEVIRSLDSMQLLSKTGIGICFFPSYFNAFELHNFREVLRDNEFYVHAIIKTPRELLKKITSVESIFVLVSREKREKELFIELESIDSLKESIDLINANKDSENIKKGIFLDYHDFKGFDSWNYVEELERIKDDFSTYTKYKIGDISTLNRTRGGKNATSFKDEKNAVYLPLIGNSKAVVNKKDMTIKEHNYIQIVIKDKNILPQYLASFLNSSIGKKYIETNKVGTVIRNLKSEVVREMVVGIPSLSNQEEIISNIQKVNDLKERIEEFSNNLSINPLTDVNTISKVDSMIEIVSELSETDRLRGIIRRGEDISTEFKQTLSLDTKKKTKEKYIIESALKTICAFFNTKGGDLVIGVDDQKNITGIDHEIEKFHSGENDKFLNYFKDLFKTHIGPEYYPYLNQKIIHIENQRVFLISCEPSDKEVFMNKKDFYVRTTPATDKLEGVSQIDYIRTRFG